MYTRRQRGRPREKIRYLQQLVDAHREFDRLRDVGMSYEEAEDKITGNLGVSVPTLRRRRWQTREIPDQRSARLRGGMPGHRKDTRQLHNVRFYRGALLATAMLLAAPGAYAQSSRPDPTRTPGALNLEVTQENIGQTICVRGWTRTVRPPEQFTYNLKRAQIRHWYHGGRLRDFEEDHLIPLNLGGAPNDVRNLWPEPRHSADGWTADVKNELEAELQHRVCTGQLDLATARHAIATDWIEAWRQYVGSE